LTIKVTAFDRSFYQVFGGLITVTQREAQANRPDQNTYVVAAFSAVTGLETMLISRPRSTSTIPEGGVISPAALVRSSVDGNRKLKYNGG
jgi:hypothetical protein